MGILGAIIILLLIVGAVYLGWRWFQNTFCSIPVVGLICDLTGRPSGVSQGGACTADSDCAGWSLFGDIACCAGKCVTKDQSIETCTTFCTNHPSQCPGYTPGGGSQGAACERDSDCAGWSLFGDIACCGSPPRCITKDQSVESCAAFCADHPTECGVGTGCESGYCGTPPNCVQCGAYISPANPGCGKRLSMRTPRRRGFI